MTVPTLRVIGVNAGMPVTLRDPSTGIETLTGIVKRPVDAETVGVTTLNIALDGQADLKHHGGVDKAVYCYPHEHLAAWRKEMDYPDARSAPFGENLSTLGLTEDDVRLGDRFRWGEVLLEVSQPRWPCFKLGLLAGMLDLPPRLIASGRSGWYCRVIAPGEAPVTGATMALETRDEAAPTVRDTFRAYAGDLDPVTALRIAAWPTLAPAWRDGILRRASVPATRA